MVDAIVHVCFYFNDSRIVSRSPFACNWQNRFLDSETVVAHFPSNKSGNLEIQIPRDSSELHPVPCMRVICCVCGLGPKHTSKQVLSLILLILLVDLTNQNKGICRHRILYPLRIGPLFPNDVGILKPKVSLGPNRIEIDLRKCFLGKCNSFWTK